MHLLKKKKNKKLAALISFSDLFSFSGESMGHTGILCHGGLMPDDSSKEATFEENQTTAMC